MFRRKKPLPPPLEPDIPTVPFEIGIVLPFTLADYPRILLDWLAHSSRIDENMRHVISELTNSYSETVAMWVMENYGFYGLIQASAMSQEVYQQFYEAVGEAAQDAEKSLFDFLEQDVNGDD